MSMVASEQTSTPLRRSSQSFDESDMSYSLQSGTPNLKQLIADDEKYDEKIYTEKYTDQIGSIKLGDLRDLDNMNKENHEPKTPDPSAPIQPRENYNLYFLIRRVPHDYSRSLARYIRLIGGKHDSADVVEKPITIGHLCAIYRKFFDETEDPDVAEERLADAIRKIKYQDADDERLADAVRTIEFPDS